MGLSATQLALLAMKRLGQEQRTLSTSFAPPKKQTKLPAKLQNTFLKNLQGVPGGGYQVGSYRWYQRMVEAVETGCRVATAQQEQNLERSAQNCNTTRENYIV
jgi:hypothetical protein